MKLRSLLFLAISILLINACIAEESSKEVGYLNAVVENDETKANVTDQGSFTWSHNDKVWVHTTADHVLGTLYSGAGSTNAKFEIGEYDGELTGYAIYPYSAQHSISNQQLFVNMPDVYYLGEDTDNTNAVLFAVLSDQKYVFTHMAGLMKFEFEDVPAGTCQFKITLDKKISGAFPVDMTAEYPVVEASDVVSSEQEKSITLNFKPLESVKDLHLYVPLPVGTYGTLNLELNDAANTVWSYSKNVTNTIERKSIILMPKLQAAQVADSEICPMLDFVFNEDGTASDASPNKYTITTKSGDQLSTVLNTNYNGYMARFTHTAGATMASGYYEYDYSGNTEFQNKLADGYSMEAIVMLDFDLEAYRTGAATEKELKPFASTEKGGTGFLVAKMEQGQELAFITNMKKSDGTTEWIWGKTGVVPEPGRYYYLVGVWDKENNEVRVYLDGQLKLTVPTTGTYNPARSDDVYDCRRFVVGGDPANNKTVSKQHNGAWPGDVAMARVYDEALTTEWVTKQWQNIENRVPEQAFNLNNVLYLKSCSVIRGGKFNIMGTGFQESDVLRISSLDGSKTWDCVSGVADDVLSATLPVDITDGTYQLVVVRVGSKCEIGSVEFTVKADAEDIIIPSVIAHRGVHDNTTIPENSIAGLTAAIDMNVYGSELDVWVTADDVLVCNHNATFNGFTLETSNYDDIKNHQLSNGEKLPTFDKVLTTMKNSQHTRLILEIKSHTDLQRSYKAVDVALEKIDEAGLSDMVEYIAFSYEVCTYIKSKKPHSIVSYLSSDKAPELLSNDGIDGIDYEQSNLKANLNWVNEAHTRNMIVNVWTVNSDADFIYWIGKGVDFITTNKPARLKEILGKLYSE